MARKPCVSCGVHERAPKLTRCIECWLIKQPSAVREKFADRRLLAVPAALRAARVPKEQWPPGRRWCAGCQTFVRLAEVSGSRCKACAGRSAHATMLKGTYEMLDSANGLRRPFTADDYARMLEDQGGVCAICGRPPGAKRLVVDHDHRTGLVRHLLCAGDYGCNYALVGIIERHPDPAATARRLLAYIKESWS